jgi:hypothetical protein
MPVLCRFYGIAVFMNYEDHAPPHFHARYQDDEVLIEMESGVGRAGCLSALFGWYSSGWTCI